MSNADIAIRQILDAAASGDEQKAYAALDNYAINYHRDLFGSLDESKVNTISQQLSCMEEVRKEFPISSPINEHA